MNKHNKTRAIQTEVKHEILREYIGAWGGIILAGISHSPVKDAHFVYVDTNAFQGWYPGDQSDAIDLGQRGGGIVYGSPVIGIEAFDQLVGFAKQTYSINLKTNAILVEKDPDIFQELVRTLQSKGFGNRLLINPTDISRMTDRQIAVFNSDSTAIIDRITQFTSAGKKFAFYFLDPYGASGIPLKGFVENIIRLPRHDVIINFPYLDLHKKTGLAQREDLSIDLAQRLQNCDRMFGHNRWRTLAENLDGDDENRSFQIEQELIDSYHETLRNADTTLAVKSIRLRFPDRERTMYYLFLTTHDPTGALQINEKLWKAKLLENELRWQLKERKAAGQQMSLFDNPAPPPPDQPQDRPDKQEIADRIYNMLKGQELPLKEVYRQLADEPYFAGEIKSALGMLRRQDKVKYQGDLKNATLINFF